MNWKRIADTEAMAKMYAAGAAAMDEGNWDEAIEQFHYVVVADPNYRDAHYLLERAYHGQANEEILDWLTPPIILLGARNR